jgi:hypothetical protein
LPAQSSIVFRDTLVFKWGRDDAALLFSTVAFTLTLQFQLAIPCVGFTGTDLFRGFVDERLPVARLFLAGVAAFWQPRNVWSAILLFGRAHSRIINSSSDEEFMARARRTLVNHEFTFCGVHLWSIVHFKS